MDGVAVLADAVYGWADTLAGSQDQAVAKSVGDFARAHIDPVYHARLPHWQVEDYRNSLIRGFVNRLAARGPVRHAHPPDGMPVPARITHQESAERAQQLTELANKISIFQALNLFEDAAVVWSLHHPDEWQDGEHAGQAFPLLIKNLDP
jgi:hypothetical protein